MTERNDCWSITTTRLSISGALPIETHVSFLHSLWTNPRVMHHIGFPRGLELDRRALKGQLQTQSEQVFDAVLIVSLTNTGELVGECKLGSPDQEHVAHTDIKLAPEYWGHGYGVEIKRALIDYLFKNTDCVAIKATPNRSNEASIRMQEAVGGRRVGSGCFEFPEEMREYTTTVEYVEYRVFREDWVRETPK